MQQQNPQQTMQQQNMRQNQTQQNMQQSFGGYRRENNNQQLNYQVNNLQGNQPAYRQPAYQQPVYQQPVQNNLRQNNPSQNIQNNAQQFSNRELDEDYERFQERKKAGGELHRRRAQENLEIQRQNSPQANSGDNVLNNNRPMVPNNH
jgi:hypothetical protein